MDIKVTKITDESLMRKACSFTSGKESKASLKKMYASEHSPCRTQMFVVEMIGIPTYASVHYTRHHIGVEHFVKSNRDKDEVITRDTPVNHMMLINAQALMNMARKRLCHKADYTVQCIMTAICDEISEIDKALCSCLMPDCEYKKRCTEFKPCGYWEKTNG